MVHENLHLILDFQIKTIKSNDDKNCKLQVWDTAGQDRFKCVVSSFYRGAHGVMICFDITDLDTFRNVDNWLEEIKRYCPENTPIFLVGTKTDLESRRMVQYPMIKAYAEKMNLTYIETSSKTNQNIEKCFTDFTGTLVQHNNKLESVRSSREIQKGKLDLNERGKRVKPNSGSGCFGSDTCTI